MIRALSPYYVTTPLVSPLTSEVCTSYTIYIKVWVGDKNTPPTEPTYQITKDNSTNSIGNDKINIARIIADFIEFTPQSSNTTAVIDGVNQMWVQTYNTYKTTDEDDSTTNQNTFTDIFSLGYSYGNEGENNLIVNESILMPIEEYKVYKEGVFIVPIHQNTDALRNVPVKVKSYPNSVLNYTGYVVGSLESSETIKYVWVDVSQAGSDRYIIVSYLDQEIYLYIEDECKYSPINIMFQNKDGAQQNITFFKEKTYSMTVTNSEFERSAFQPQLGYHQFVRYDVQGRTKFKANSGYLDESANEAIKQLLLSERIWLYDGAFTPINIKSSTVNYKTRQKERLINYELEFEMSYNEINNV